jgi:hypothetical protein
MRSTAGRDLSLRVIISPGLFPMDGLGWSTVDIVATFNMWSTTTPGGMPVVNGIQSSFSLAVAIIGLDLELGKPSLAI